MPVIGRMLFSESIDFDELTGRGARRAKRAGYQAVGEYWVAKHLPRHFIRGAGVRYGYTPRSAKYEKKKRAIAASNPGVIQEGGRVLLVFSGALRDHLLSGAGVNIRAFPTRVTVRLTAPHGLPMRPKRPSFPHIGEELTTVADEELPELQTVATRAAMRDIKAQRTKKRTTLGGT
jgi:hypothetical protein